MRVLRAPRHFSLCSPQNASVRAQAPRAKGTKDNGSEDTLFSVDDVVVGGGDAQQLAAKIQESMLSPDATISTAPDDSGRQNGSLIASSAPEWMVCFIA